MVKIYNQMKNNTDILKKYNSKLVVKQRNMSSAKLFITKYLVLECLILRLSLSVLYEHLYPNNLILPLTRRNNVFQSQNVIVCQVDCHFFP